MSEALELDLAAARVLADACGVAGRAAGDLAGTVRTVLGSTGLSTDASATIGEISDELLALERFVRSVAERTLLFDRYGAAVSSASWYAAARAEWGAAATALWATLSDDVGATALAAGSFSLGDSIVRLARHDWLTIAVLGEACRTFGPESGYLGGGAIVGPDGRAWPMVVPEYRTDSGAVFTIDADLPYGSPSAASLGGVDPGWVLVGYRSGVEEFHEQPDPLLIAGVAAAAATGMRVAPVADDDALAHLRFEPGTRPSLAVPVETRGGSDPSALEMMQTLSPSATRIVDGAFVVDPSRADLINLPGNLATLLTNGLQGLAAAAALGRNTQRGYEVLFEQHADGRRRARVQSFRLEARSDGPYLYATHLFVDDDGRLMETNASYQTGPSVVSADALVAGNGSEMRTPWPVPNTVVEVRDR